MQVVLVAVAGSSGAPKAARVEIANASGPITALCVKLDPSLPATFVLQRDASNDPAARISITVSSYLDLAGDTGEAGKEFGCPPGMLPPPLTPPQKIDIDFCASAAKKLVFYAGSECQCDTSDAGADAGACTACSSDKTCGAGENTEGHPCGTTECCYSAVKDACSLDPAH